MPALSQLRRVLLICAAVVFALATPNVSPLAATTPADASTATTDNEAAVTPIVQLDDALLQVMKAGRATPFQQRYDILAPAVERAIDLSYVLRISVGPSWSSLTADQQQALLAAFRRYTVASYLDNFDSYDNQKLVVSPTTRPVGSDKQVVDTQIVPATGTGHTIDYVMHQTPDGWKAIDVLADGSISRVAVQRSDFSALLSQGGVPALQASLQEKTAALARG
jgi:phospholipid transport system substrate-binding protein